MGPNTRNIAANWKCQEETGATITLLVRQLKKEKKVLTPIQTTLFLAGLYEDTGNLTFPSSTAEDAYPLICYAKLLFDRFDLLRIKPNY